MVDTKTELNDEELASVQGGSFLDRGQTWSSDGKHRLIVTIGYYCELWRWEKDPTLQKSDMIKNQCSCTCSNCKFSNHEGLVLYCNKRFHDNDPLYGNWTTTSGRF